MVDPNDVFAYDPRFDLPFTVTESCGVAQSVEQVTVNDQVVGSSPASTVLQSKPNDPEEYESTTMKLPEMTFMQEDHKLFAVMGHNKKYAIQRIPRQFLHMDEDEQKWFLNSQGIAKKLLKKLGLL